MTASPSYFRKALDSACDHVRLAASGTRNDTLAQEAFSLSRLLGPGGLDAQEVYGRLLDAALACGLSEQEANSVLRRSFHSRIAGKVSTDSISHRIPPRIAPKANPPSPQEAKQSVESHAVLGAFLRDPGRDLEADLWHASPLMTETLEETTSLAIAALYRPGESINIVTEAIERDGKFIPGGKGTTLLREEWLEILARGELRVHQKAGAWIRINPLDGRGIADANVTAYRYLLLESDCLPLEHQLALLASLPGLAMIVSSGGKSVHGWVRLDAEDVEEYRQRAGGWLAKLSLFGIDPANRNPSRLSRLPGVMRGSEQQRLIYLNPNPPSDQRLSL